jgi:hypothetical protein
MVNFIVLVKNIRLVEVKPTFIFTLLILLDLACSQNHAANLTKILLAVA